MMKRNVAATFVCLIAFVSLNDAQDAKSFDSSSSGSSTKSTSSLTKNDEKDSNKRSAVYEGSPNLNSGFKPIIPNYHSANSYYGNPQLLPSSANSFIVKHPIYMIAPTTHHHSAPFASPLIQHLPSNNFYSSYRHPQHHHQIVPMAATTFNQYQHQFNPFFATAAMSPIFANHHPGMFYHQQQQAPVNSFYANIPHQIHKIPIYNQQPQTFPAASSLSSYRPLSLPLATNNNVKQAPSTQFSHSKPVALKSPSSTLNANISPLPSLSTSHVEHNEGAVSYAQFSTPSSSSNIDGNKASPLTFNQHLPQNHQSTYYQHQPQPILSPAYSKLAQYAASSFPSNHYATQGEHYANNVPFSYAHFSKIPSSSSSASSIKTASTSSH